VKPDSFEPNLDALLSACHPDDRDTVDGQLQEALRSGAGFVFQARIAQPEGEQRRILIKGDCERQTGEAGYALFGVFQDITEKHDSEESARKSNTLLSAIAHAQAGYIDGHAPADIFAAAFHSLLTLTDSELGFLCEVRHDERGEPKLTCHASAGIGALAFDRPDDQPKAPEARRSPEAAVFRELVDHTLQTGKLLSINDPLHDPRFGGLLGRHHDLESFMGLPIKIGARLLGVVGLGNRAAGYKEADAFMLVPLLRTIGGLIQACRNDAQRERAEAALLESQTRYDLAVKGSSVGVWDWNLISGELYWSPKYREIAGITDEDFTPTSDDFRFRIHPDDREGVLNALENHLKIHGEYDVEFRFRREDDAYLWLHMRGQATWDDDGRPLRMAGSVTDISGRKRAEQALFEAKDRADAANRAKSDFLANMSHEIRTPMNAILGTAELLHESGLNEAQKDYCRVLHQAGVDLLQLIDEILDLSRVESGRLELRKIVFDFYAMAGDVVNLYNPQAYEKGLNLVVRYGENMPRYVEGDPVRLKQILSNLISNAIKYTDQGYVLLDFSVTERRGQDLTLRMTVTDTGVGVPKDKKALIFEKFAQVDGSSTRPYRGVGLGLAICKRLTALMGGEIGVESQVGAGSVFWFTIQARQAAEEDAPEPTYREFHGLNVLSVSDSAISRQLLEEQLTRWEIRHASAAGPVQAAKLLADAAEGDSPFHIVLVEFQRPEEEGVVLAKLLADAGLTQKVDLILLTASGKRGDADKYSKLGFSGYLAKPLPPSCIMAALLTVWRNRKHGLARAPLVTRHLLAESGGAGRFKISAEAGTGPTILLVEDNPSNQMIGQHFLESLGCRATVAANGQEALDLLDQERFALILMDCQMPKMDGFEATGRIRGLEAGGKMPHTPIVALTANAMQGDRERCLAAGMDEYLAKPLNKEALRAVLARFDILPEPEPEPVA